MEIMNPYIENFRDVKICRLCGSNNKENVDIFTSKPISSRSEDLLTKILTVYPIVLYKDDPLPQHICPKCIGNVSTTYQAIQQVMRQQNKWMNMTKAVQPEHKYFHILNVVENSTKSAKETIKASYNIEINNIPLGKFLATSLSETKNQNQNSLIKTTNNTDNVNETVVKNIQNKLESNGFTIRRIKVAAPPTNNNQDFNGSTETLVKSLNVVTCNYCKQKFSDLKILAQHQLTHLKLSVNKIFQKHFLPKNLRRGRLITINDNKCIRCLNCWRLHTDNKAILQHWSGGECEFYCFICGKEFPHSPKMLREHVTELHGISYRSAKSEFMTNSTKLLKAPVSSPETRTKPNDLHIVSTKLNSGVIKKYSYKKPPPKSCTKNDDGTITCKICQKVFDNFRSSNSHMRKHKPPPNRFRDQAAAPTIAEDNYNREDDFEALPSTSTSHYNNNNTTPTNPLHIKPPRPAYKVIMKNGPLRGIKTKIVQKRQEFLNNYRRNEFNPMHSSVPVRKEINDDDDNLIVPELLTSAISTEHSITNNINNNARNSLGYGKYGTNSLSPAIKSEPVDNSEYVVSQDPRLCFICNESFSNNRDYELHAMFVHNIN